MDVRAGHQRQAVKYLLGELSEADQARLEEGFFQDAELSEVLSECEDDLIDQYVRDELSARERERFESHFLISERRRDKVEFARALLQAEAAGVPAFPSPATPLPWWKALLAPFSAPRPALAYSLAAVALLFLVGGLWQVSEIRNLRSQVTAIESERTLRAQQEDQLRRETADQIRQKDELAATNETLKQELAALTSQADTSNDQPRSLPAALAFILSPGARDSEAPRTLVVPRSTQSVRLQLNINPGDRYAAYKVKLQTTGGVQVRRWDTLRAASIGGARAVSITVPAKSLRAGQYELTLSAVTAPGRVEDLGYYYFNLRNE